MKWRPIPSGQNMPILPAGGTSLIIRENIRLHTRANIHHASILRRVLGGTVYFKALYYLPY